MSRIPIKNDITEKHSKGVITIHWITASLIFVLFPLGKYMADLAPENKLDLIKIHAILGILIFSLTIARAVLFFTVKRPKHLDTGSKFNDLLAVLIHYSFYSLLLILGTSGIATMISGGYIDALTAEPVITDLIRPRTEISALKYHNILAGTLIILVFMHIAGVIRFNIKHKTNALKRIT
ncbi:MAG: cytochrome b/b6 domain-containing protein [Bacteroidia bacterium]|nr:cytochrome b/b6 domain-containing protein [Bacteroidia bacterium]